MSDTNKKKSAGSFEFKKIWGPLIWSFMHTLAYVGDSKPRVRRSIVRLFNNLVLPCPICQRHYKQRLPVKLNMTLKYPLSRWVYDLHVNVGRRTQGAAYKPPPFKDVIFKFEDDKKLRRSIQGEARPAGAAARRCA